MTRPPHHAGGAAARDGLPHTDCPIPKPAAPATGEDYPGDWANWMAGWINARSIMGQDAHEARIELCNFMAPAIGAQPISGIERRDQAR